MGKRLVIHVGQLGLGHPLLVLGEQGVTDFTVYPGIGGAVKQPHVAVL